MKRILIFSDTHGNTSRCMDIINNMGNKIDAVIHAGDYVRDAEDIESVYDNIPIHYVCGNCDIFSNAQNDLVLEIGGAVIFVTHGHMYNVKNEIRYRTLTEKAKSVDADLCIFGHTHIPYTDFEGKLTILNPGSLCFGSTYAIAEIEDGKVKTSILKY